MGPQCLTLQFPMSFFIFLFSASPMSTLPGAIHIAAMQGRRKGGAIAPPVVPPPNGSLGAHAAAYLDHLAARALSPATVEFYRWSLRGLVVWNRW